MCESVSAPGTKYEVKRAVSSDKLESNSVRNRRYADDIIANCTSNAIFEAAFCCMVYTPEIYFDSKRYVVSINRTAKSFKLSVSYNI